LRDLFMASNINGLNRRLNKIQESLPRRDSQAFEWDYSLFTPVEQAELQLFMESFPEKLCETSRLSGEKLAQFGCWLRIERALRNGDMTEAEKWRRRRATTLEQLVDRFLNLDISSIPEDPNEPCPKVVDDKITYTLSRVNYRTLCWSVQYRPEDSAKRDDMWRWIEYLERAY
jgi:hypothetical protein